MTDHSAYASLQAELLDLESKDNLRTLRTIEKREGPYVWIQGKKYLNLSSNDYLGLAGQPGLQQEYWARQAQAGRWSDLGFSASSSRLLAGTYAPHSELEADLALGYGQEACLTFSSGYHANVGLLSSLLGPEDVVFTDRLNHASLVDGILLSGAKWHRYRHGDLHHLETLLVKYRSAGRRAMLVTESIFSMDGDRADLAGLAALKNNYHCWLYVDEAHALGVFGPRGLGLAEVQGQIPEIDFLVGTFGKALAGLGAFVVGNRVAIRYILNRARPFIFSTALPPLLAGWIKQVFSLLPSWQTRREQLAALSCQLRAALQAQGLEVLGNSHILPIVIGDNARTLALARRLQAAGYLLFAIRPPTVPAGTSRLRISLTADMTWNDVSKLPGLIRAAKEVSA